MRLLHYPASNYQQLVRLLYVGMSINFDISFRNSPSMLWWFKQHLHVIHNFQGASSEFFNGRQKLLSLFGWSPSSSSLKVMLDAEPTDNIHRPAHQNTFSGRAYIHFWHPFHQPIEFQQGHPSFQKSFIVDFCKAEIGTQSNIFMQSQSGHGSITTAQLEKPLDTFCRPYLEMDEAKPLAFFSLSIARIFSMSILSLKNVIEKYAFLGFVSDTVYRRFEECNTIHPVIQNFYGFQISAKSRNQQLETSLSALKT